MLFLYTNIIGLIVNTISIPYDHGANIIGSRNAPNVLKSYLDFLQIDKDYIIDTNQHLTTLFGDGFLKVHKTINDNKFPLTLGGDHTVAISSIPAVNQYCNVNNERLGIVWCDAHADFNTMETSPSKNLHGMPVAIMCGHTLPSLSYGQPLDVSQFGYYGVRDIDSLEFERFQKYDMTILDDKNVDDWFNIFDKIHVSFDIDCLDPSITDCVNTPVPNGKTDTEMKKLFKKIKDTNKLISLDIVEYNSEKGKLHNTVIDIIKELF